MLKFLTWTSQKSEAWEGGRSLMEVKGMLRKKKKNRVNLWSQYHRFIECLGSEGTLNDIKFKAPCCGRRHFFLDQGPTASSSLPWTLPDRVSMRAKRPGVHWTHHRQLVKGGDCPAPPRHDEFRYQWNYFCLVQRSCVLGILPSFEKVLTYLLKKKSF